MNKKLSVLVFFLCSSFSQAKGAGPLGAGLFLGEPLGVIAKYKWDKNQGVDMLMGWSFSSRFYIHADYLYHLNDLIKIKHENFDLHFGAGGALPIKSGDTALGLRLPVGIDYMFRPVPVEVYVEFALLFYLSPSMGLGAQGGIGGRYYF